MDRIYEYSVNNRKETLIMSALFTGYFPEKPGEKRGKRGKIPEKTRPKKGVFRKTEENFVETYKNGEISNSYLTRGIWGLWTDG